MRIRTLAAAAAVALLAVGAASAQELTATRLLDKVYQRYAAIKDYQDSFTIGNKIGEGGATLTGEMAFRRPDRLAAITLAGGPAQIVIDGKDRWTYVAGLKEYTQESLAGANGWAALSLGGADLGLGISDALNTVHLLLAGQPVTDKLVRPKLGDEQTLGELPVHVVELGLPETLFFQGTFQLWIGKEDNLVHRMVARARAGHVGGRGVKIEIDELHKDIKVDQGLGDERFGFTPPPDAKRVDVLGMDNQELAEDSPIGKPAPDLTLSALNGEKISIASFQGKPVMVHTWASWEPASLEEMPDVEAIHQAGKAAGLVVLGVNSGDTEEDAKAALKATEVSYPILLDPEDEFGDRYDVFVPGAVYIDKGGVVRALDDGLVTRGRALRRLAAIGVEITVAPGQVSPLRRAHDLRTEGTVAFLTGHDDTAVARFRAAAEAVSDDPMGWFHLGVLRAALGNYDEADKAFAKATALDPDDAELVYQIASAYLDSNAAQQAVANASRAAEMQPKDSRYWHLLGRARLAAGDLDATLVALNKAAALNDLDPAIQFDLGTAYEKKGDRQAALAAYRNAAKGSYPGAAEAIKRLATL